MAWAVWGSNPGVGEVLCLFRPTPMPLTHPHFTVSTGFWLEIMWSGRGAGDQRLEMVYSYTLATSCSCKGMSWGDLYIYIIPLVRVPCSNIPKLGAFNLMNEVKWTRLFHYWNKRRNLDVLDSYLCSVGVSNSARFIWKLSLIFHPNFISWPYERNLYDYETGFSAGKLIIWTE